MIIHELGGAFYEGLGNCCCKLALYSLLFLINEDKMLIQTMKSLWLTFFSISYKLAT